MSRAESEKIRHKVAHILNKLHRENRPESIRGQEIPPLHDPRRVWHEKGLFWGSAGLWAACVLGGVQVGLAAYVMPARYLFVAALPFGLVAVWCFFGTLRNRAARISLRLICSVACIGLTLLTAKYTIRLPMELTITQKMEFTKVLKSGLVVPPSYTIVSCPDGDEQTCLFAATFIPVFQRAGWKVGGPDGPEVERARLKVPQKSISIISYGPPKIDPQDPDHGVWTKMNPWAQTLATAFFMVGIDTERQNDPQLPIDEIRIYFGSVPER